MADHAAEIRALQYRVSQLERMLVGTYALLVGVVLVLGLLLPFVTERAGDDEEAWSIVGLVLTPQPGTEFDGLSIALLIGFIGLIVVTVVILAGTLIPAAMGVMTDGLRVFGRVLAILGIIGAVVVLILALQALGQPGNTFGWGAPVLLVGMIAVLPLVSSAARDLVSRR